MTQLLFRHIVYFLAEQSLSLNPKKPIYIQKLYFVFLRRLIEYFFQRLVACQQLLPRHQQKDKLLIILRLMNIAPSYDHVFYKEPLVKLDARLPHNAKLNLYNTQSRLGNIGKQLDKLFPVLSRPELKIHIPAKSALVSHIGKLYALYWCFLQLESLGLLHLASNYNHILYLVLDIFESSIFLVHSRYLQELLLKFQLENQKSHIFESHDKSKSKIDTQYHLSQHVMPKFLLFALYTFYQMEKCSNKQNHIRLLDTFFNNSFIINLLGFLVADYPILLYITTKFVFCQIITNLLGLIGFRTFQQLSSFYFHIQQIRGRIAFCLKGKGDFTQQLRAFNNELERGVVTIFITNQSVAYNLINYVIVSQTSYSFL